MLAQLRAADVLPWTNLTDGLAYEMRVIQLGKLAGAEGARLASAILDETERLLSAQDRETERLAGLEWEKRP